MNIGGSKEESGGNNTLEQVTRDPSSAHEDNLVERARSHWQSGEWESLVKLDAHMLERHPDRAKLALIVASAWQQLNDHGASRRFVKLALEWGCDKKLIARVLVADVHNTLGRAAALSEDTQAALSHFRAAVSAGSGNASFASNVRAANELKRIGLAVTSQGGRPALVADARAESLGGPLKPEHSVGAIDVEQLADTCAASDDVRALVAAELSSKRLSRQQTFEFLCALSQRFRDRRDDLTAQHFLRSARRYLDEHDEDERLYLARKFIGLNQADQALDLMVQRSLHDLNTTEQAQLRRVYQEAQSVAHSSAQHGHVVLIDYIRAHSQQLEAKLKARQVVLIEIGTTREDVVGQGSTRKLAEVCRVLGLHFITVDMDPDNTRAAARLFDGMGVEFSAVNSKGEDYLREYKGDMDFVFLDAYDFDHGKHSELRQSRYRKFLGGPIEDQKCHQMHLECAQAVKEKLSEGGVVCVDDSWLVEGKWIAKGTLAVPYLISNGFEVLEARNHAVLLRRVAGLSTAVA